MASFKTPVLEEVAAETCGCSAAPSSGELLLGSLKNFIPILLELVQMKVYVSYCKNSHTKACTCSLQVQQFLLPFRGHLKTIFAANMIVTLGGGVMLLIYAMCF